MPVTLLKIPDQNEQPQTGGIPLAVSTKKVTKS
jgi:hypothetical protein